MDNMRRVLVLKLTQGDYKKYKSLESKMNEIGEQHGEKVHRRQWNEKDKTCEVDISFRSEDDLIQACIKATELLSENGLKEELISRKRILPKEIERDLKEFKEAVAAL